MGSVGIQHIDFAAKFSSPLREHVLEPTESRLGRVFLTPTLGQSLARSAAILGQMGRV